MARRSKNSKWRDHDHSKVWAIEITPSVDHQNNLDRAIELILQAANRGDRPDLGGSGSTGLEVD